MVDEGDFGTSRAAVIETRPTRLVEGSVLEATGISITFGGLKALKDVSLKLEKGEILGLIGPNGAGKTTFLNVLSGFLEPDEGQVLLNSEDITNWPSHRRARSGLSRTFQGVNLFGNLTVLENVEAGGLGVGMSLWEARKRAGQCLLQLGLAQVTHLTVSGLNHAQQRRLGIARALATEPGFLLLDEPAAGLSESESDDLLQTLVEVRDNNECALLLIEHDMRFIMRLCDRIQVLDYGSTIATGSPQEIQQDPEVIRAYLGD